jgi:riboflavin transporter FmnP
MKEAFSPIHRVKTIILLVLCISSAIGAVVIGIDDNLPGIVLAFLAALSFILAFVHPWRTARKFLRLLLAAVLGLILFVVVNILIDTAVQNPTTPLALRELTDSPAFETMSIIIIMILPAAILIGIVGWIVMVIRSRLIK